MSTRICAAAALACAAALIGPGLAVAQEDGDIEAFGSFSYLFADIGGSAFNEARGPGFTGGFAFFLNDWLASTSMTMTSCPRFRGARRSC